MAAMPAGDRQGSSEIAGAIAAVRQETLRHVLGILAMAYLLWQFIGVGSAACAAVLHRRRGAGADLDSGYAEIAQERIRRALEGSLPRRPMDRPVNEPDPRTKVAQRPDWSIVEQLEV